MSHQNMALLQGGSSIPYSEVVLEDSPWLYWPMDDASPAAQLGNASSSITLIGTNTTQDGGGWDFDGSTSYSQSNSTVQLLNEPQVSFECWITAPAIGDASSYRSLVYHSGIGETLSFHGQGLLSKGNQVGMFVHKYSGGYRRRRYVTDSDFLDGDRHHVVGVFNAGDFSIYVDGVSQSISLDYSLSSAPTSTDDGIKYINVGSWYNDYYDEWVNRVDGVFEDVAIYKTALSSERVLAHYNAGV